MVYTYRMTRSHQEKHQRLKKVPSGAFLCHCAHAAALHSAAVRSNFMQSKSPDMCEGPLVGKIILYTIPIILTGILQLLFNAADLVVVGRCCGDISVAAVGATGALINLIVNLFIGLSVGAGVTVAHSIGAGRTEDVKRTVLHRMGAASSQWKRHRSLYSSDRYPCSSGLSS